MTTLVTARPEELLGRLTDLACRGAARVLYLQGDRSLLELGTRVAVVGSRQGHRHGGPPDRVGSRREDGCGPGHRPGPVRGRDQPAPSGRDRRTRVAGVAVPNRLHTWQIELSASQQVTVRSGRGEVCCRAGRGRDW